MPTVLVAPPCDRLESTGAEPFNLDARLAMAEVLFEHDELDLAEAELEAALSVSFAEGMTHLTWRVEVDLVRVMIAQQRQREALNRVGQLRHSGYGTHPPPNYEEIGPRRGWLPSWCGRPRWCSHVAGRYPVRTCPAKPWPGSTWPRAVPTGFSPAQSSRLALPAEAIRRFILLACAEMQHGREPRADEHLCRAVELGRTEGYIRPFVQEASQILPLLRVAAATRPDPYLTQLMEHAERAVPARLRTSRAASWSR